MFTKRKPNRQRLFNKRRSIVFTWLVSYLLILMIPVIISSIMYTRTISILETEINRANESILMQVQQEVDSKITDIKRISYELSIDKKVIEVGSLPAPSNDEEIYRFISFARDLRIFKAGNEFLEGLYLYFKNNDTIIGPNTRISMKSSTNDVEKLLGMNYSDAKSFISGITTTTIKTTTIKNEWGEPLRAIIFASPVSDSSFTSPETVALFVVEEAKLLSYIHKIPSVSSGKVVIINSRGEIMARSSQDDQPVNLDYKDFENDSGMVQSRWEEGSNVLSYITSRTVDWKYIMIMPADIFWQKAMQIRNLTYLSIALCILLGGIAAYLLLKNNYSSVKTLVKSISDKLGIKVDKKFNEYVFIQDAITNTINENKEVTSKLKQQNSIVRDNLIIKLIKGRLQENLAIYESLSALDINFDTEFFSVLIFHIDSLEEFLKSNGSTGDSENNLVEFIIRNVMEELLSRQNNCYFVEMDNMIVCLLNSKINKDDKYLNELFDSINEGQKFINEQFRIYFTVAVSNCHNSIREIPQAYGECMEALEYRLVMGSGKVISYKDIEESHSTISNYSYYYPLLVEQQLVNYIKVGDYEGSLSLIQDILEKNIMKGTHSVQIAKCLMFNLAGTILKTTNDMSAFYKSDVLNGLDPAESLLGCDTVEKMKLEIANILRNVCIFVENERKNESTGFNKKVKEYIDINYNDATLNVASIGEYFQMAPSYVSKLFKEQSGEALLDYLNKIRVNKAKELMKHYEYTVQEICTMVGYNDLKTFTRNFKKFEGVTPGKFKEINL